MPPKSRFSWVWLLVTVVGCFHLLDAGTVSVTSDGSRPTSLYPAPSYRRLVPQPFIITSKPLIFSDSSKLTTGRPDLEIPTYTSKPKTSTKVSLLSYVPGVATIVCKGSSCGMSSHNSQHDSPQDDDPDTGFGEAVPVEADDQYMTVTISAINGNRPISVTNGIIQQLSGGKFKPSSASSSFVHLITSRPYLERLSNKKSSSVTTTTASTTSKPTTTVATTTATKTTTTTKLPTTIFRRRLRRTTLSTPSTTAKPVTANSVGNRRPPSMFIPAITAFTLMALPVAAAAVPLIIQAGKKRRRRSSGTTSLNQHLIRILNDLNNFEAR